VNLPETLREKHWRVFRDTERKRLLWTLNQRVGGSSPPRLTISYPQIRNVAEAGKVSITYRYRLSDKFDEVALQPATCWLKKSIRPDRSSPFHPLAFTGLDG
jgi:hypothetical protein